jgi:TPR repeat protein
MQKMTSHRWLALLLATLFVTFALSACFMDSQPRNMNLKAFNPHRADFTCAHEANKLPPITNESEILFQQGMAATSNELWPNQRDYKQASQLWEKAATLGHWKAAMNLAGLYERGVGVQRDTERAVLIVEGLMEQGVPGAFDKMGTYHRSGIGVKPDIDRAHGFWQLAADMGSPAAQAFIGHKLDAVYDDAQMGIWRNRKVGVGMLECAFTQGFGEAAYRLGQTLNVGDEDFSKALVVLHEGVKFGSQRSAEYLSSGFGRQEPLTGNLVDRTRADRYSALAEALELNPDLRFPNLDKVLPLPPAPLPFWDGQRETLINAAKAVVVEAPVQATPGAIRPRLPADANRPDASSRHVHATPNTFGN